MPPLKTIGYQQNISSLANLMSSADGYVNHLPLKFLDTELFNYISSI